MSISSGLPNAASSPSSKAVKVSVELGNGKSSLGPVFVCIVSESIVMQVGVKR